MVIEYLYDFSKNDYDSGKGKCHIHQQPLHVRGLSENPQITHTWMSAEVPVPSML